MAAPVIRAAVKLGAKALARKKAKALARKKLSKKIAKQVAETPESTLRTVDPIEDLGKSSQKLDIQIKQSGGKKKIYRC